jgi:hypothetical protein
MILRRVSWSASMFAVPYFPDGGPLRPPVRI